MLKKMTAISIVVCLLLSCFSFTAFAALPGDVDGDGTVTSADARLTLRASVQLETLDKAAFKAADVDGDGSLTSADARVILRVSVRLDAIVDGKIVPADRAEEDAALRVLCYGFNGCFSPFFSETAEDQNVWSLTSVSLLGTDRYGAVVEKGVSVEPIPYNGTDYTYPGMSDLTVTANSDGTVWYDFVLRDGVTFSDGEPLTADDVIFSMYVLCDPTYDGSSTFFTLPIEGLEAYRNGMEPLSDLIFGAGRDNTDFTFFTAEQQRDFWEQYDATTAALVRDIVDFCTSNGYAEDLAGAASAWGFDGAEDEETFAAMLSDAYGADVARMVGIEAVSIGLDDCFPNFGDYSGVGVRIGESAESITGIRKTGKNSLRVVLTEPSAPAVYQMGIPIAPLHYYGDASLYDYDHNRFGFPKGDLSGVRARTAQPLGAGPYVFEKYENGEVSFTANERYFLGAPEIKRIRFLTDQELFSLDKVAAGALDVAEPAFTDGVAEEIAGINGNGKLSGDKIVSVASDNLGYGYLGISAKAVNVGGDPGSAASRNLRKAFATVFAVYRDISVSSYYGEAANVIDYPISNTSWAAPQKTDADYEIAYSRDAAGGDIYTDDMDAHAKAAAALDAALGYFEAAGYTVEDGKVTAAPEGAGLEYEVWIPADGCGDHPSYMMLDLASDALASIGVRLNVVDLANSSDLWGGLEADLVQMWCAAWGAAPDPDMYQIYYSGVEDGSFPGSSNYMYDIADAELDRLILEARAAADRGERRAIYKKCLDIIMDWAVEVPVYQRQNVVIFSAERVKADSILPDVTAYYGWMNGICQMKLN